MGGWSRSRSKEEELFRVEPIEAKGFNHFLPGTLTLSVGRSASNLAARFQVNGTRSEAPGSDMLASPGPPREIARCAREQGCPSVVFDGGEPAVAIEDAIELAESCREFGLKTVVLTRGYVCPEPRAELYRHVDAVRVELPAFRERFYWKFCGGHIAPVLDTLAYLARRTPVWLEIAVPLLPGENDTFGEVDRLTLWIGVRLGRDIPLHFMVSHFKASPRVSSLTSPPATMTRACQIARANGLRYVYTDDLFDPATRGTFCHGCGGLLIGRDWYLVTEWNLRLRHFNLSVQVTEAYMAAVRDGADWPLVFPAEALASDGEIVARRWTGGLAAVPCRVVRSVPAPALWDQIMRATYDHAEPGVLFSTRSTA